MTENNFAVVRNSIGRFACACNKTGTADRCGIAIHDEPREALDAIEAEMAQMRTERDKANDGQHMLQQKLMNVKQQLQDAPRCLLYLGECGDVALR